MTCAGFPNKNCCRGAESQYNPDLFPSLLKHAKATNSIYGICSCFIESLVNLKLFFIIVVVGFSYIVLFQT